MANPDLPRTPQTQLNHSPASPHPRPKKLCQATLRESVPLVRWSIDRVHFATQEPHTLAHHTSPHSYIYLGTIHNTTHAQSTILYIHLHLRSAFRCVQHGQFWLGGGGRKTYERILRVTRKECRSHAGADNGTNALYMFIADHVYKR